MSACQQTLHSKPFSIFTIKFIYCLLFMVSILKRFLTKISSSQWYMPLQISLKKGLQSSLEDHILSGGCLHLTYSEVGHCSLKKKKIRELKLRKYDDLSQHCGKRRCLRVNRHQRRGRGVGALKLLCRPPQLTRRIHSYNVFTEYKCRCLCLFSKGYTLKDWQENSMSNS